uniref:Uncharacterized protein n=1 Tax=Micrurus lemniscatus lemniscatus TaxID=129467 RepID=A0A2D4IIW1_MICLE
MFYKPFFFAVTVKRIAWLLNRSGFPDSLPLLKVAHGNPMTPQDAVTVVNVRTGHAKSLFPVVPSDVAAHLLFLPSDYCEDWTEAQRISESLLDSRSYETLVDFDNHLDDIRNDWTNPEINKAVLHLC